MWLLFDLFITYLRYNNWLIDCLVFFCVATLVAWLAFSYSLLILYLLPYMIRIIVFVDIYISYIGCFLVCSLLFAALVCYIYFCLCSVVISYKKMYQYCITLFVSGSIVGYML